MFFGLSEMQKQRKQFHVKLEPILENLLTIGSLLHSQHKYISCGAYTISVNIDIVQWCHAVWVERYIVLGGGEVTLSGSDGWH